VLPVFVMGAVGIKLGYQKEKPEVYFWWEV
jgi:hypothetical protein